MDSFSHLFFQTRERELFELKALVRKGKKGREMPRWIL